MWVQILLFTMLKNYTFWKDYKFTNFHQIISNDKPILFVYFLFTIQLNKFFSSNSFKSNFLINMLFFKKKNFNKLYLNNTYILLTPGIVLKFNNLFKKNLKKKPTLWNLFFLMFTKINNFKFIWKLNNFFLNNFKLIKFIKKYNLLQSWIFINLFKQNFRFKYKTIRRIKKWVKKKYFKINI